MARSRKPQGASDIPKQRNVQRQELDDLQQAAPIAGLASSGGGSPVAPPSNVDVFGPSARPGEPVTAGAQLGPGVSPPMMEEPTPVDPDLLLRRLYRLYPHPGILRLVRGG